MRVCERQSVFNAADADCLLPIHGHLHLRDLVGQVPLVLHDDGNAAVDVGNSGLCVSRVLADRSKLGQDIDLTVVSHVGILA